MSQITGKIYYEDLSVVFPKLHARSCPRKATVYLECHLFIELNDGMQMIKATRFYSSHICLFVQMNEFVYTLQFTCANWKHRPPCVNRTSVKTHLKR